jgi:ParB-like chromosome segregation protein Spo0J
MIVSDLDIQAEWTQLDIEQIKPDPKRPRRRQRRSVSEIAKSLQEFGFLQALLPLPWETGR